MRHTETGRPAKSAIIQTSAMSVARMTELSAPQITAYMTTKHAITNNLI